MDKYQDQFRPLIAGFYAWMSALFFGGVLLDIVYSGLLRHSFNNSETALIFSTISDIFLKIVFVTLLAALGAIVVSWNSPSARNLFLASLLFFSFEFLIPVFFSRFIQNAQGLNIGPWLRILPTGTASILAFAGFHSNLRQR